MDIIKEFSEIKIFAINNNIKITTELPRVLGYKTLWGVKCALKTDKGKIKIQDRINSFLEKSENVK